MFSVHIRKPRPRELKDLVRGHTASPEPKSDSRLNDFASHSWPPGPHAEPSRWAGCCRVGCWEEMGRGWEGLELAHGVSAQSTKGQLLQKARDASPAHSPWTSSAPAPNTPNTTLQACPPQAPRHTTPSPASRQDSCSSFGPHNRGPCLGLISPTARAPPSEESASSEHTGWSGSAKTSTDTQEHSEKSRVTL